MDFASLKIHVRGLITKKNAKNHQTVRISKHVKEDIQNHAKDICLEAADLVMIVHTSIKISQTQKKVVNIQEQLNY